MKIKIFLMLIVFIFSAYRILIESNVSKSKMEDTKQDVLIEARKIASVCLNKDTRQNCYKEQLSILTTQENIFFVGETLSKLQEIDPSIRSCHGLAHELTKHAVRQDPSSWKTLLAQANPNTCGGGLMHGIIEAHTGYDPNAIVDSNLAKEICLTSSSYWSSACIHTFGHIALLQSEGNVNEALQLCEGLPKEITVNCFNGLFMEDSFKTNLVEHGFVKKVENPTWDPKSFNRVNERCAHYGGTASIGCWADLGSIIAEFYKFDYQKTFNACQKASNQIEDVYCYFRAIASIGISKNIDTKDKLLAICSPYLQQNQKNDIYKRCTHYLAESLVYNSPSFIERADMLCSSVSPTYQEDCFRAVGDTLKISTPSQTEREIICKNVEKEFKNRCINGTMEGESKLTPFGIPSH